MTPYKLSDVLGAMLVAVTEAQYISDLYTDSLYPIYSGDNELDALAIPNTQFDRVRLHMSFAIADVILQEPPTEKKQELKEGAVLPPPVPQVLVYVNASDLNEIPEKDISRLDVELSVEDMEALPSDSELYPIPQVDS